VTDSAEVDAIVAELVKAGLVALGRDDTQEGAPVARQLAITKTPAALLTALMDAWEG
jgi:hypothetical protein